MSLLRKLAGETAFYGLSYILSRVLHYILFTFYLTRVFNTDPAQYGIYRDLYFYVAVLVVVLTFRMETTYFRYAKDHKPIVTTMSLFFLGSLAGLFLLGVWIFNADVARMLEYPQMGQHILMLGGVLFFDVISAVPFASLRQQNRPVRFLLLKLTSILLNIFFVLFFIEVLPDWAQHGGFWNNIYRPENKLWYVILGNLLASAITFFLLLPLLGGQRLQWDFRFLGRMVRYAWPMVIGAFAGVVNQYSSIAFQKHFLGDDLTANLAEGGKYAAAASLAIILSLFTTAYNYAAEPFFFAHKDKEGSRPVYADAALAYTIVGSVIMLAILGYIDVFQLLLGRNFREGLEVVPILLVAFLFLGIYNNVSAWYKLADKTLYSAWIALGGTTITIVLSILLIPSIGVIGSAWTALACYVFMVATCYVMGQKFYPIPYRIWRMVGWIAIALFLSQIMNWARGLMSENVAVIIGFNTLLIVAYVFLVVRIERGLVSQITGKLEGGR